MFHFFHKTYLNYVDNFAFKTDSIFCFETKANAVDYGEDLGKKISGVPTKHLGHFQTSSEMLDNFGGSEKFFKDLATYTGSNNDGKLIIWCDPRSFNELIIRLWKTIFPSITSELCFVLYNLSKNNSIYQTRDNWLPSTEEDRQRHLAYYHLNKQTFEEAFNSLQPFEVSKIFNTNVSIEYLIASYLAGDKESKDNLESKYMMLYEKELVYQIINIKKELEDLLYELDAIWPSLGDVSYTNFDWDSILKIKPELGFLGNTSLNDKETLEEINAIFPLVDIFSVFRDYFSWDQNIEPYYALNTFVQNNFSLPSFDQVIQMDFKRVDNKMAMLPILGRMQEKNKINIYAIGFFQDLIKNDPQVIKKFSMLK